ncbi:hypothetical protein CON65_09435 [Bacillus pseudomycoides]|uniref:Uncharacterized protein n=1 Tax=Bacillus pseudomycoides TaxID=64104 RepID=A0AA91VD46_9BACI|nr:MULTISPECIES: hypothetical protein [Bacillus]PEB48004.1 hypothetical protein COO03_24765 [Bacillus sp. AFS098217]PED82882.1 hypothetical protein CON65_09435 [Bacillus pseudomycoides]PEU09719.1 hypothetical protein CN524_17960 [Bacillus sp. AFS019443]PEU18414.1 hypothetical protein CN525_11760 [Bacillus sp. AFS014408]PFW62658.1 hypothetical protein COL20_12110 [Bacillus sp. AFS075034]
MSDNNTQNELQLIQRNFEKRVSNTALELAKAESKLPMDQSIIEAVEKGISVDTVELSKKVEQMLDIDEKQSNEQIAIKLLEDISSHSDSKFMRKLASSMLKEKWWEK